MAKELKDIKVGLDEDLEEKLQWMDPGYSSYAILRKSVDARKRNQINFIYSVKTFAVGESKETPEVILEKIENFKGDPVIIIGAGPAGLFAAYRLLQRGIKSVLIEQGEPTEKRVQSIAKFWRRGVLNPHSNVGFGEGGAGLFSDGKLITRIKSPHIPYVMKSLVKFGAPAEIEYLSNPHVGSDKIRRVIPKMRQHLESLGCQILFNTKVKNILFSEGTGFVKGIQGVRVAPTTDLSQDYSIPGSQIILAAGHSTDLFTHLHENSVSMEGKSFAMGLRVEHSQELINKIQYKDQWNHPKLGAANYKLAHTDKDLGLGVYSFCMCPGGYVLSSGTEDGYLVSNGMSNYNRNSPHANSAIVVSIDHHKNFKQDLFGGLKLRSSIESEAYTQVQKLGGTKELPTQKLKDFMKHKISSELPKVSSPSGAISAPLHELFSKEFQTQFIKSMEIFDRKMKGFAADEALLIGVESRTSCPLRITRDPNTLESLSHKGLYPAGEGAGYAGGITSAACDGVSIADKIFESYLSVSISSNSTESTPSLSLSSSMDSTISGSATTFDSNEM